MILFVFEGKRREPEIFRTLEYLFFPKGQKIICSFGNNIYELYRQLKELGAAGDNVSLLRENNKNNPNNPFSAELTTSDFSEVFLFFDYDFQNKNLTLSQMNQRIEEMLTIFSDETDKGKLYINYPMLEAIRYTKSLPDSNYSNYTISRAECQEKSFKEIAQQFSDYGSLDFFILNARSKLRQDRVNTVRHNWELLVEQNVFKANYLCNGKKSFPIDKDSISQVKIFASQLAQYIQPKDQVSILSAFPLFKFDYFK